MMKENKRGLNMTNTWNPTHYLQKKDSEDQKNQTGKPPSRTGLASGMTTASTEMQRREPGEKRAGALIAKTGARGVYTTLSKGPNEGEKRQGQIPPGKGGTVPKTRRQTRKRNSKRYEHSPRKGKKNPKSNKRGRPDAIL